MKKIIVAGIGPGSREDITPAVVEALRKADAVVGYQYYFQFIQPLLKQDCICVDTGMKKERQRAEQAFELAEQGKTVVVISSGDAGIYGMTPLVYEMRRERGSDVVIESLPGISAFQKAASLLGAPIGHDMCIISLSDLLTPWDRIRTRLELAAEGDFVIALYNPSSKTRQHLYEEACRILLDHRSGDTVCGWCRNIGRPGEEWKVCTLRELERQPVDMLTTVFIGNSKTRVIRGKMVTPRGYMI